MFKTAPLRSSFMLAAILGFVITAIYAVYGRIDNSWSFTLCLVFIMMFIASVISITHTPISEQEALESNLIQKEVKFEKEEEAIFKKRGHL